MKSFTLKSAGLITFLCLSGLVCQSQVNTVGLILSDTSQCFNGYTLFAPMKSHTAYLIDINGNKVNSWTGAYLPGSLVMLCPDGNLLRTCEVLTGNHFYGGGGVAGRLEKYDWNNNLVWSFDYYGSEYSTHHDVEIMPNGNILLLAWEKKTMSEVVEAGRDTTNAFYNEIWSQEIVEIEPTGSSGGNIVWEWHVWDHLVQNFNATKANYSNDIKQPQLMNINFGPKITDWLHFNSVRFNPERNEIMVSSHGTSEVWIIDHSTTTAQAAGHSGGNRGMGGDILYRWGNPRAYGRGTVNNQKLFSQHDCRWIEPGSPGAGNILIFNNGLNRPAGPFSSVMEIVPPIATDSSYYRAPNTAFGPSSAVWTYVGNPLTSFYSMNISGATRLPNGNTLICYGINGDFFEVTTGGQKVWEYINPTNDDTVVMQGEDPINNMVFKMYRYAPDFSGFNGVDLTPSGPVELYPPVTGTLTYGNTANSPLPNTKIYLKTLAGVKKDSATTGPAGDFNLLKTAPGTYVFSHAITKQPGGFNATDALMIAKYFVGQVSLTGLNLKAADVNMSGYVNSADALDVLKRFTRIINSFALPDWLITADTITVGFNHLTHDIKALCAGDVNGSFIPLLKSQNNVDLSVEEGDPSLPSFAEIVPNPVSQQSHFICYPPSDADITFTIMNTLGEVIQILPQGIKPSGIFDYEFDGSTYRQGLYLVKFDIRTEENQYSIVRRMLITK
ncbi:MAG: aryl-sulfate sulfotransferase [Bacteroidetes bacterium]|nr:aryl-sulfate sulfotransferase [Bacteroidota bacterium]